MMRRLALVLLPLAVTAACFDWDALEQRWVYVAPDPDSGVLPDAGPPPDAGSPEGAPCFESAECSSALCAGTQCRDAGYRGTVVGAACGKSADCTNGLVCEPVTPGSGGSNKYGPYVCNARGCAKSPRLCTAAVDCCVNGTDCNTCLAAEDFRECNAGVCGKSAVCGAADAGCAQNADCCTGLACSVGGGSKCLPAVPGNYPDSFKCESPDLCDGGRCTGTSFCASAAAGSFPLGTPCNTQGDCHTSSVCSGTPTKRCCIEAGKACVFDTSCCSGNCVDGVCSGLQLDGGLSVPLRQRGQSCRESNDCQWAIQCAAADAGGRCPHCDGGVCAL